jgi:hypothetical protein
LTWFKVNFIFHPLQPQTMKILWTAALCCCWLSASTQQIQAYLSTQTEIHLWGKIPSQALWANPYAEWFKKGYDYHQPDTQLLPALQLAMDGCRFQLFLGTWCGDSKREVPKILKIMSALGCKTQDLDIIALSNQGNDYKKGPQGEEKDLNIVRVPSLLVYRNNKALGRIIEYPVESWEKDLLKILRGETYTPHYSK